MSDNPKAPGKRPGAGPSRVLKGIGVLYLSFPVTYLFVATLLYDMRAGSVVDILLSPLYYFVGFWAVLAGYGIREMRRWGWYVLAFANVGILYANAVVLSEHGQVHHDVLAFLGAVAILGAITYLVMREVRVPYFLPRIRWWEDNTRYQLVVPVSIVRKGKSLLQGQIMDISQGGCFVKISDKLPEGENLVLRFNVFGQVISCRGFVVWSTDSTVTHPKGIGVRFDVMARRQRRRLKIATQRLRRISAIYRRSKPGLADEIVQNLNSIQVSVQEEPELGLLVGDDADDEPRVELGDGARK